MNREQRIAFLLLFGGTVLALAIGSLWSLYQAYQTAQYSPAFASAVATFTLVVITAWYAWSTRKLLGATQAQTEATRASFAPHLDARLHSRGPDFFSVDLVNRGQGVATDIEVEARIYTTQLGDFSVGDRYRFKAHVIPSLPPNTSLGGGPGTAVQIKPKFFTAVSDKSFNQVIGESFEATIPEVPKDVISYLSEYMSNPRSQPNYPTEVGDINDLIEKLRMEDDVVPYPFFEVWVRYNDTLSSPESYEERIFRARLDLERENFQQACTTMPSVTTTRGIRRWFAEFNMRQGKGILPHTDISWDTTPLYESDISAPVVRTDLGGRDSE